MLINADNHQTVILNPVAVLITIQHMLGNKLPREITEVVTYAIAKEFCLDYLNSKLYYVNSEPLIPTVGDPSDVINRVVRYIEKNHLPEQLDFDPYDDVRWLPNLAAESNLPTEVLAVLFDPDKRNHRQVYVRKIAEDHGFGEFRFWDFAKRVNEQTRAATRRGYLRQLTAVLENVDDEAWQNLWDLTTMLMRAHVPKMTWLDLTISVESTVSERYLRLSSYGDWRVNQWAVMQLENGSFVGEKYNYNQLTRGI